jgi:hypothetical protein
VSEVQEIEYRVKKLNTPELKEFRDWFADYDSNSFDKKIDREIQSGKLESLAINAIEDFKQRTKKLVNIR